MWFPSFPASVHHHHSFCQDLVQWDTLRITGPKFYQKSICGLKEMDNENLWFELWLKNSLKNMLMFSLRKYFFLSFFLCEGFLIKLFSPSNFISGFWTSEPSAYIAEHLKRSRIFFSSSLSDQPCGERCCHHADVLVVSQLIHDVYGEILSSADFKSLQDTISFLISLTCLGLFHFLWHRWPILDAPTHTESNLFICLLLPHPSSNCLWLG